MANRLLEESSPYLQMHAQNPVNWYPWGNEAIEKAKKEKKLLIVSIGYAACHWCHVMEKESFTDPGIANIMNKFFVAIKVDREERPDIDELYMSAIQLIGGRGGWPLNAFALPDGRPLYAVTYLPSNQWQELLHKLADLYNKATDKAIDQAVQIEEAMRSSEFEVPKYIQNEWPQSIFSELFERWFPYMDLERGGYKNAPKFPLPVSWDFFLHYYLVSKDQRAVNSVRATLNNMGRGGIFDQIGGGFSRYSVDEDWRVPHFEKMLYDNAQLVSLYSHAFQLTKDVFYKEIVRKTVDFIQRELMSGEGAFYTSLDADSRGNSGDGEGEYYTWNSIEIENIVGEHSALIKDYFAVTKEGNWENGRNILHCVQTDEKFLAKHNIDYIHWNELYQKACSKLLEVRKLRSRPPLDDKILTSWNALMIKGLIDGYMAFNNEEYLGMALSSARFLKKNAFQPDGTLKRNLKPGKTLIPGFLDDYACLADAWLSIYQATLDISWLDEAVKIIAKAIELFEESSSGLFFYTPLGHEQMQLRKKIIQDNVMPSPVAIMAKIMHVAGIFLSNSDLISRSEKVSKTMIPSLITGGPYMAGWSSLILNHSVGYKEVNVFGPEANEWINKMRKNYLPHVLIRKDNLDAKLEPTFHDDKRNRTFAVICKNNQCGLPIYSSDELIKSVQSINQ
jgi:uncharacterized protein